MRSFIPPLFLTYAAISYTTIKNSMEKAIIAPVSLHVPSIISQKNINTYFCVRYAHNTYINNTAKGYSICIVVDKPRKIG